MKKVQDNIAALESALEEVKNHCMCLYFREDENKYFVQFPEGDFEVGGIQVSKAMGKVKALEIMLEKMEYYWISSFPSYVH
jgi:hypothetical protein